MNNRHKKMETNEAIKTLKDHKICFEHDFGWNRSVLNALDTAIDALAANVAPVVHGRWEIGGMFGDIGRCSNCHYMFPADTAMSEFHYCPNCGARMDKDGDGE